MDQRTHGDLLVGARAGNQADWDELVARFTNLLWSVARSHRLSQEQAADVVQATWLKLVEHLDRIREPAALPGWLSTTARNECLRVIRRDRRSVAVEDDHLERVDPIAPDVDEGLLADERQRLVWDALARLGERCQQLLRLMMADPAPGYDVISETLDMPIGSIGPTRGRCLDKLRTILERPRISGDAGASS